MPLFNPPGALSVVPVGPRGLRGPAGPAGPAGPPAAVAGFPEVNESISIGSPVMTEIDGLAHAFVEPAAGLLDLTVRLPLLLASEAALLSVQVRDGAAGAPEPVLAEWSMPFLAGEFDGLERSRSVVATGRQRHLTVWWAASAGTIVLLRNYAIYTGAPAQLLAMAYGSG